MTRKRIREDSNIYLVSQYCKLIILKYENNVNVKYRQSNIYYILQNLNLKSLSANVI